MNINRHKGGEGVQKANGNGRERQWRFWELTFVKAVVNKGGRDGAGSGNSESSLHRKCVGEGIHGGINADSTGHKRQ